LTRREFFFIKNATKIQKLRGKNFGTIFRWAYGNPYGAVATIGMKVGGASYPLAMGVGAGVGIAATYLTRVSRALRLAPEVLEKILTDEVWPGKKSLKTPTEDLPETTGAPPSKTPSAPRLPAPGGFKGGINIRGVEASTSPRSIESDIQSHSAEIERLNTVKNNPKATPEEKASAENQIKTHEELRIQKIETGKHGIGKLAEQAKARARVAQIRKEKGPTGAGGGGLEVSGGDIAGKAQFAKENAKAKARAQSANFDLTNLQIPEMEEYVRGKYPEEFKSLLKQRRAGTISDIEWKTALEYLTLNGLED